METNEIPDMVIEIRKEFGAVGLNHMVNNVSEQLGLVTGIKIVGTIVHVCRFAIGADGKPYPNKEKTELVQEVIEVPSVLLMATDEHGADITKNFLKFADNLCKEANSGGKLGKST
ncbi:MAG: hypothetical protein JKY62_16930 [Desulfocapsa sp.]|nr:hypothetical protein [Desulfocapsa sp.]